MALRCMGKIGRLHLPVNSLRKMHHASRKSRSFTDHLKQRFFARMVVTDSQNSLPRLPVPPLDQTLQKYLRVIRPLVTDDEFRKTEKIVEDFRRDPGPKLQSILEKRAEDRVNWLSDWWRDVAYLNFRSPVIINSNPAVVLPKKDFTDKEGQLRFAAKVVSAVLEYKSILDEGRLGVEMLGGQPLCMTQFHFMFGSCRVPGEITDTAVHHSSTKHISVMHNNQIFSLDVYGSDGRPLNTTQLYEQLVRVVERSQTAAPPVGVLTMTDRTSWAKTYHKLVKDKSNMAALEDIQRAIFILSLDGAWDQQTDQSESIVSQLHSVMHGVGRHSNYSGNRWFDKTLQILIGENGTSGINFEHTPCDGPPLVHIMQFINQYCEADQKLGPEAAGITAPRKMDLSFTEDVLQDIQTAKEHGERQAADLQLKVWSYSGYGKEFVKSHSLSPDAFVQTILQLAYYRLYGQPCATYESGSLRRFQQGRTDTIRSCSIDSFNFTKAMGDESVSSFTKADLFCKAVTAHRNYTNEVVNGNGIDRHLLGWKLAASEAGMDVPNLYKDPTFSRAFHFNLSTSQLTITTDSNVIFGAVVPDGYGVFYNIKKSSIIFSLSSYYSCSTTDVNKLVRELKHSLDDVRDILASPKAKI